MTLENAYKAAALLVLIVTATVGSVTYFQSAASAKAEHEYLAETQEADRLNTRLELLKIRLERFLELAKVRPLTEAEQIELRALEREQAAILERLAAKS